MSISVVAVLYDDKRLSSRLNNEKRVNNAESESLLSLLPDGTYREERLQLHYCSMEVRPNAAACYGSCHGKKKNVRLSAA